MSRPMASLRTSVVGYFKEPTDSPELDIDQSPCKHKSKVRGPLNSRAGRLAWLGRQAQTRQALTHASRRRRIEAHAPRSAVQFRPGPPLSTLNTQSCSQTPSYYEPESYRGFHHPHLPRRPLGLLLSCGHRSPALFPWASLIPASSATKGTNLDHCLENRTPEDHLTHTSAKGGCSYGS
jgi:hypothetical protein